MGRKTTCRTTRESRRFESEKTQKKSEENKVKEGEMWNRLNELNGEFKKIRESKKEAKKISATIVK